MNTALSWPARATFPLEFPKLHLPLTEFGLPEMIEIEPIHTCNLRCTMCHVSYEKLSHEKLDVDAVLKNLKGLENRLAVVGATHEPAAHPQFARLMQGLSELGMKIQLTTNGTLLSERLVKETADCLFDQVTISFDGIRKETYERIRRNANFERAVERITNFRRTFAQRPTQFQLNYTMLRSNLDEVLEAVEFWDKLEFDLIGFIVMVIRDRNDLLLNESLGSCMDLVHQKMEDAARTVIERGLRIAIASACYQRSFSLKEQYPANFFSNLVVSNNPAARVFAEPRSHIQNGPFPGVAVDCRSPFKQARILYNGDVQLCSQFKVGNIHEKPLLDIWFGTEAKKVRDRIQQNAKICYSCDYYRFCIRSAQIDYEKEDNFFAQHVLSGNRSSNVPKLIESDYKGFNLVHFRDRIYGLAQSIGPFDLLSATEEILRTHQESGRCVIGDSASAVKARIDQIASAELSGVAAKPARAWPTSVPDYLREIAQRYGGDSSEEQRLRELYEDLAQPPILAAQNRSDESASLP